MQGWVRAVVFFAAVLFAQSPAAADDFDAWILSRGRVEVRGQPAEAALSVGSVQKPFVARAWARTHTNPSPHFTCTPTSGCWRPSGHGTLDLRGAIRESCNTFFRLLARETPQEALQDSFRRAGFAWTGEISESEAIGLPGPANLAVPPSRLLESYVDLVRTPWPVREDVRQEMLAGLKDAAEDGTASGVRLRGFRAKTGTVPALDGAPLKTSGFALVLDDAGFAFLGLLRRGTGREAAIRAGLEIAKLRPRSMIRPSSESSPRPSQPGQTRSERRRGIDGPVRVDMLGELRLSDVRLTNLGPGPVDSSRGFVGPGATTQVVPGDRFGSGQWEIRATKPVFERRIRGSLQVLSGSGPLRLVATMTARDYANGVIKAELGLGAQSLRAPLAASVLRFLHRGPRHPQAEVCDSTHCAWFVGEGPVPRWLRPDSAVSETKMAQDLSDVEWAEGLRDARLHPEGPDHWTADCGGDPVSPHFIWGGGDRKVVACPRHPRGRGRVWRRDWSAPDLAAVFGSQAESIDVASVDGQWMLTLTLAPRSPSGSPSAPASRAPTTLTLTYDEAHRRLASRMGWDAMPAPASRVSRTASGFVAEGVGFGHRVGLCLAP